MGGGNQKNPAEVLRDKLIEAGFDAFIHESPLDRMKKQIAAGERPSINMYFAGKMPSKISRANKTWSSHFVTLLTAVHPLDFLRVVEKSPGMFLNFPL